MEANFKNHLTMDFFSPNFYFSCSFCALWLPCLSLEPPDLEVFSLLSLGKCYLQKIGMLEFQEVKGNDNNRPTSSEKNSNLYIIHLQGYMRTCILS